MAKKAIIIGAGPAGLTAAYELLKRTDIIPIILEKSGDIGGISKTINYKGNRMDMGPHRFFSKSDRVMNWWLSIFPLQSGADESPAIHYQNKSRLLETDKIADKAPAGSDPDKVMLLIQRLTRIYFLRKFFAYPIQLSIETLRCLGIGRALSIIFSYLWIKLFPRKPEKSLEDFIINKFGKQLYLLFFKDYTEKVWGVPCHSISAEWGAQRIKGVSLSKAIEHALRGLRKGKEGIGGKDTETSLIEQFLYPKKGPGQLWEEVARQVEEMGGKIYLNQEVQAIYTNDHRITMVSTLNPLNGQTGAWEGDYFFSTMPVKELIAGMMELVPIEVDRIAAGLQYRDFINAGVLLKQLSAPSKGQNGYERLFLKDNWIYIQERDVKVGRLMIYNNWGGGMVKDPDTTWIGMEYFCNQTDDFWQLSNAEIEKLAIAELEKMGLARKEDVLDITIQRMEKTYPAYFGTYNEFDQIRTYTDTFENLFLVGRNGMHKYNNADHSMLTAMVSVDNIIAGITSKENIWAINTEQEYHEEKKADSTLEGAGSEVDARADIREEVRGEVPELTGMPVGLNVSDRSASGAPVPSFLDFAWKDKWNRRYVLFALVAFLAQFILFKIRYPFANYMPDSYSYLEAAYRNVDVNMWPVAYSKFLRVFSAFTHSDSLVVGFQYFFIQCSGLVFLYTLLYLTRPGKVVKNILYAFFLFNPVALYVSNYISADSLFIGFSLLWITQLCWIVYRPRPYQLLFQAFLLLAVFTLRYNAIYYPLISALAFLISKQGWKWKLGGIVLGSVFILSSVLITTGKMQEMTGKRQFAAFGGWQLANNALYMYEHIPVGERVNAPDRFAKLETLVRQHMDTLNKVKLTHEDSISNFFYLWSDKGPLVQYMVRQYKNDSITPLFKRWASEGPLYNDYALWLIRTYPIEYASYFVLPNIIKYAYPPPEFLGIYNMGSDSVNELAKEWFNYKTRVIRTHNAKHAQIMITQYYSYFATLINAFLILCLIGLGLFTGFTRANKLPLRFLLLVVFFWIVNMGFSVLASPIVLRYQIFPILISFSLGLLAAEAIYIWGKNQELKTKNLLT